MLKVNEKSNIMNTKIIDNALMYYGIDDKQYKNKCYDCLENINNNTIIQKEFNTLFNILFVDKTNKIKKLWDIKLLNMLFSEPVHPYITSLLLLSGYEIHEKNMNYYKLEEEQKNIHKLRVKEALINDIKNRGLSGIRISQMLWGAYFINLRLIEVGRLQYEYENSSSIKIHIPATGKLYIDKVIGSLEESRFFIKKYFKAEKYNYYCNSWLLSKEIHNLVDKNSNIYKFYELFEITEGKSCVEDVLNFVYKTSFKTYNELQEQTSLQRNIKKYLLDGNDIKLGQGILKKEKLNSYIKNLGCFQ